MSQHERISGLKHLPILAGLSDAVLERIARSCQWRRHEAGEQIVGYQDPSTDVCLLLSGKARAIMYSPEARQ